MYYLAQIDLAPGHSPEELGPLREAEDDAVRALVAKGLVTDPFMRTDKPGAIFLLNADGEAEARAALDSLPAFKAGIITTSALIPLTPHAAHPQAEGTLS